MFLVQKAHCNPINHGKEPELMIIDEKHLGFLKACAKQAKNYVRHSDLKLPMPEKLSLSFADQKELGLPRWIEYGIALEDCDFWPFLKNDGAVFIRELPEFMRDGRMDINSGSASLEVDLRNEGSRVRHVANMPDSQTAIWTEFLDLDGLERLPVLDGEWLSEEKPVNMNYVYSDGNPQKVARRLRSAGFGGPGR